MTLPRAQIPSRRGALASYVRKLAIPAVLLTGAAVLVTLMSMRPPDRELARVREANTARGYVEYAGASDARRDTVRGDLAALHEALRQRLHRNGARPTGLDPLLVPLLARVEHKLGFVGRQALDDASFATAAEALKTPHNTVVPLAAELRDNPVCDDGVSRAFAELTGNDLVEVRASARGAPRLVIDWTVRAMTERAIVLGDGRTFPGLVFEGKVAVDGAAGSIAPLRFSIAPPLGLADEHRLADESDGEVARTLVRAACKQIGLQLIQQLSGWKSDWSSPTPPAMIERCQLFRGTACILAARAVHATDRRAALDLLDVGCHRGGGDDGVAACYEAAALAATTNDALSYLGRACAADDAEACTRYAERVLATQRSRAGFEVGLTTLVRACDLGSAPACRRAAALFVRPGVGGRPLYAAAAVLAERGCEAEPCPTPPAKRDASALGIPLGADQVFDVHWEACATGPQIAIYVASRSELEVVQARMRGERRVVVYRDRDAPPHVISPVDGETVWRVTLEPSSLDDERPSCAVVW